MKHNLAKARLLLLVLLPLLPFLSLCLLKSITAIYLSKKILIKIVAKKTGKTKDELADKSIIELYKLNKSDAMVTVVEVASEIASPEPKTEAGIKN